MFMAAVLVSFPLLAQSPTSADSLRGLQWLEQAAMLEDEEHQYAEAIVLYEKCLPLFEKCGYLEGYFKAKIGIAYSYSESGQHDKAKAEIAATIREIASIPISERPITKLGDAYLANGTIYQELLDTEPAVASYEKAFATYESLPEGHEKRQSGMAAAHHNLGNIYVKAQNFPKAMGHLDQALELKKKVYGPTAASTLSTIQLLADTWLLMGFLNKSLELQKGIVEIKKAARDNEGLASAYREISKIYQRKKDYKTAEEYIRMAMDIYGKKPVRNLQNIAFCEHQMGNVVKDGGRYAESISWFKNAIEKQDELLGIPNLHSAISTLNIAKAYNYLEDYPMAVKIYHQAWGLFDKTLPKDHPRFVELWLSIGASYYDRSDLKTADIYYSKAYHLAKKVLPEKSFDRAQSCFYMTQSTADVGKALAYCQEGLQRISAGFSTNNLFDNPPIENIYQEQVGLRLFQQKIYLLQRAYGETCNKKYLEEALKTTQTASSLVDLLRQSFFTESAKNYLAERARKIYESGVEVAFQLQEIEPNANYLEQAFELMEKSRSLILLEELHGEAANQMVKIPDSLAFHREVLKKEILYLETQFQLAGKDMAKSQKINEQLFSDKEKMAELEKYIGQQFPEIAQLMNSLENINLTEVQYKLGDGESLLEYLIAEKTLFLLKISNEKTALIRTELPPNFQQQATEFVKLIKDPELAANAGMSKGVYLDFKSKSRAIYKVIIGEKLSGKEKKIIIVPDQYLSYLPFEILLANDDIPTGKVDYSSLPYLLRFCPIRYAFSANLQFSNPASTEPMNLEVLAYSPEYEGSTISELTTRNGFSALTQTKKEVADIIALLGGEAVTGPLANEANFKKNAARYGILHLAMHAFTDEENPMLSGLIFSDSEDGEDGILRPYELQSMKLNAQLAVLSACNTGSGKLEKGEGIMSLGRTFRRAGVPNIVMSLWQVDDEATRLIMVDFYRHLKTGSGIDEALRQAKLDYLDRSRKTFPFYWGAFVLMGEQGGVHFEQQAISAYFWMGMAALGLLLVGYVAWFFLKQKKNKSVLPSWP